MNDEQKQIFEMSKAIAKEVSEILDEIDFDSDEILTPPACNSDSGECESCQ